ncbi:discoidin domain-containing protein [Amycolatopsis sp. PS_44_ISF1]|uniref:discoidin domain-containing protein n=1 Tax=Amycolatopsis sp. PS_44_ISF1 TaxID=2974917 RepID=UPI0028E00FA2|nr:discoidin domain-containing protein [Amycolatopsis sp. PS_44_ISF1]MDT8913711.1 discoidin domain-containing protein [Amycolatopsis sp. PS_44_ISF1]
MLPLRTATWSTTAVLVAGLSLTALPAAHAAGNTYYVDPAGSDTAPGTSTATAWRSLGKVNSQTLQPGDTVRFKAGATWTGQLTPSGSGSAAAPVTIASYGAGAKPKIAAAGLTGAAVQLTNQHDVTIDGLDISNTNGSTTYRDGIVVAAQDAGALPGIALRNLSVHDIDGPATSTTHVHIGHGGIVVKITGNTTPTYYTGLTIENNEIATVHSYGITTWSTWMQRDGWTSLWSELGLPGNGYGAFTPSTGMLIRGNYVHDIDNGGIATNQVTGTLIEHNRVARTALAHGNVGIWWSDADNTVVQDNEVSETMFHGRGADGTAFDSDESTYGSLVQHNYSHDNGGGFFLSVSGANAGAEAVIRYNISKNDGNEIFTFSTNTRHIDIYNNTIDVATTPARPLYKIVQNYHNPTGISFRNNIFVNPGGYGYDTANITYQRNLYQAGPTPPDASKLTADPQFIGTGSPVSSYRLGTSSPARNAGLAIAGNGGRDILADPLPSTAPALGALEPLTATPAASSSFSTGAGTLAAITDQNPATSWASPSTVSLPGNLTVDLGAPQSFDSLSLATAFGAGQGITGMDIQTWDGTSWNTVVAGAHVTWSSNTTLVEFRTVTLPVTVTSTKVRLVVTDANRQWGDIALYELALGGGGTQALRQ